MDDDDDDDDDDDMMMMICKHVLLIFTIFDGEDLQIGYLSSYSLIAILSDFFVLC